MGLTHGACFAFLVVLPAFAGCVDAGSEIQGPCAPGPAPLLLVRAGVNDARPPPAWMAVVHDDGEVWEVTYRTDYVRGAWANSSVRTVHSLDIALTDLCAVFSWADLYPSGDGDPGPVPGNVTWRASHDILSVDIVRASAPALDGLRDAMRTRFFELPEDASIEGCEDGAWIAYRGVLDGRSHRSTGDCQWTAEFERFRVTVHAFVEDPEA